MWLSGSDCSSHVKCYCCSMYKDWYKSLQKFLKILPPLGHVWTARLYKHHAVTPFFCCSKFKEKFAIIHSMVITFLNTDQYSNTCFMCVRVCLVNFETLVMLHTKYTITGTIWVESLTSLVSFFLFVLISTSIELGRRLWHIWLW